MVPYDFNKGDWKTWNTDEEKLAEGLRVERIRYARSVGYAGMSDTKDEDDRYMKLKGYE